MTATTRLVATIMVAASLGVALATGGAAFLDGGAPASASSAEPVALFQELTATIQTDWLAPVSARRSLDERNQALERWVAARGGSVRVLDTASVLRTRSSLGARLHTPAARFERTLIIRVPSQHAPEEVALALEGVDATVASITPAEAQARRRVEF